MNIEGDLNSLLSREFKKLAPQVYAVKLADKYRSGLSDFILWLDGTSVALECKLAETLSRDGKLLKHPFSPTQMNFFRHIESTGCLALGLIGFKEQKVMNIVLGPDVIKHRGNFTLKELQEISALSIPMNAKGVEQLMCFIRRRRADARS